MNWYTWTTLEAFTAWHNAIIQHLNLPKVGVNARTQTPQPHKQQTLAYTTAIQVSPNDYRAAVDPQDLPIDPEHEVNTLLGTPSTKPPMEENYEY